jgi:hypothetical protein
MDKSELIFYQIKRIFNMKIHEIIGQYKKVYFKNTKELSKWLDDHNIKHEDVKSFLYDSLKRFIYDSNLYSAAREIAEFVFYDEDYLSYRFYINFSEIRGECNVTKDNWLSDRFDDWQLCHHPIKIAENKREINF